MCVNRVRTLFFKFLFCIFQLHSPCNCLIRWQRPRNCGRHIEPQLLSKIWHAIKRAVCIHATQQMQKKYNLATSLPLGRHIPDTKLHTHIYVKLNWLWALGSGHGPFRWRIQILSMGRHKCVHKIALKKERKKNKWKSHLLPFRPPINCGCVCVCVLAYAVFLPAWPRKGTRQHTSPFLNWKAVSNLSRNRKHGFLLYIPSVSWRYILYYFCFTLCVRVSPTASRAQTHTHDNLYLAYFFFFFSKN